MTIKIVSKKHEDIEDIGVRTLEIDLPDVLKAETIAELIEIQGEDFCYHQILEQLKIKFRSHVRTKMDAITEDNELVNSDEEIMSLDFSEWKSETRTRKSAFEKAMDLLGKLPPEEREAALAKYAEMFAGDETE